MRLLGRVSDEKIFTRLISGDKTTFFWGAKQMKEESNFKSCQILNLVFDSFFKFGSYFSLVWQA